MASNESEIEFLLENGDNTSESNSEITLDTLETRDIQIKKIKEYNEDDEFNNSNSEGGSNQDNEINSEESCRQNEEYMRMLGERAENRKLIELLDDTSYNNDLKDLPTYDKAGMTKCGGDSYREGWKSVGNEVFKQVNKQEKVEGIAENMKQTLVASSSGKSEASKSLVGQKKEKTEIESKTKSLETRRVVSKSKKDDKSIKIGDHEGNVEVKKNKKTKEIVLENEHIEMLESDEMETIGQDISNKNVKKVIEVDDEEEDDNVKYASTSSSSSSSSVGDENKNDQESLSEYGKGR